MYPFIRLTTPSKTIAMLIASCILVLVTGCAVKKRNAQLEHARAVYDQVLGNPAVLGAPGATLYLNKARATLDKASKAEESEHIRHLAYLGEKEALIAKELAERKKAEKELHRLDREKTRVILEKRLFDTARARKDTARALAQAQSKSLEAQRAMARAKQLEKELSELQAAKTERGLVFTLGDVLFATGKATLLPSSVRNLDKLAKFLNQNTTRKILVEGHTDNTGSDVFNIRLSERRAYAVRIALLEKGISPTRISSYGYGENQPVADNTSRMGRQQNRRVEIVVLNES